MAATISPSNLLPRPLVRRGVFINIKPKLRYEKLLLEHRPTQTGMAEKNRKGHEINCRIGVIYRTSCIG